ncbi:hypothetical protein ACU4GD_02305 [Cupriavidus basilensis]
MSCRRASPLLSGVIRALPAGLAMLAWGRRLARGGWWWKAALRWAC